jgi:hypothetical protein
MHFILFKRSEFFSDQQHKSVIEFWKISCDELFLHSPAMTISSAYFRMRLVLEDFRESVSNENRAGDSTAP